MIGTTACWRKTSKAVFSLTNEMKAKCLKKQKKKQQPKYYCLKKYKTYVFSFAIILTSCTSPNDWKQFSISAPVVY